MKNKSPNLFIDPHPDEWLTSERLEFLRNSISPLLPLLQESNLFDKLLSTWIKHEIIKEKTSQDSLKLEKDSIVLEWCKQHWEHRLESLYLEKKNMLELVTCKIIRVQSSSLAYELYYRIKAQEASFDQVCIEYSVGKEKFNGGKLPTMPLCNFPEKMQSALLSMKAGDLHSPVKYSEDYAVLQLDNFSPAAFNDKNISRLLLLQLSDWQQGMLEAVHGHLISVE